MKLCVCGSRTWTDKEAIRSYLEIAAPTELIVGDCPTGADAIAWEWAEARGIPRSKNFALWEKDGKAAGPKRNERMLRYDKPELVVAFRMNGNSPGTDDLVRRARTIGIPVEIIREAYTGPERPKVLRPTKSISAPRRA